MKYNITGHKENDDIQIARLFKESFGGRDFDIQIWHRNNDANPLAKYCVASMWDGDTLIAHTELTMTRARLDNTETVCGVSGTTMAKRGYPGASVAVYKWIDEQYKNVEKIGFPNDNSFPLTCKVLKHNYIGEIDFWWKGSVIGQDRCFYSDYSIEETTTPSDELSSIAAASDCRYSVIRDKDYVIWRFINRPEKGYRYFECWKDQTLCGYIVLNTYLHTETERSEVHGQIIDILASSDIVFSLLIQYAENWFYEKGIDFVKLWFSSKKWREPLEKLGFKYGLRPFHVELWHYQIPLDEMYITMADSDVF